MSMPMAGPSGSGTPTVAMVFNLPSATCLARNASRPDRQVSSEVVEMQIADLSASLPKLAQEGFDKVYLIDNSADIDLAHVFRTSANV